MKTPARLRRGSTHAALTVGVLALALMTGRAAPATSTATVRITDFKFAPSVLTVPAGTTVTWTNRDEEPHTITSTAGAFGSAGLSHEETFTQTFTRPGTYPYFCQLHPHMKATVVVR
jgi:plastocyanin